MANRFVWKSPEGAEVPVHVGDTVRVHYKLIEHEKVAGKTKREVKDEVRERVQVYEGLVLAIKGIAENTMITVRRIASGNIGMERIFPVISPWIRKLEVKKHAETRRAKLYFLRGRIGREATRVEEAHAKPVQDAKTAKKSKPKSSASAR